MLNWLRRKKPLDSERPTADVPVASVAPVAAPAKAPPPAADGRAWQQRLAAAGGDEALLLECARSAPLLETKLAAVLALESEAALRQAEREFRRHDRKVHQLARRRLAGIVAKRETRAKADAAIAGAQALLGSTPVPVNRLAELHRDWAALAEDLLEATQRETFAALRERLDAALHAQDEAQRAAQWSAQAMQAAEDLERACAAGDAARIEAGVAAVQVRLEASPAGASAPELAQVLRARLAVARQTLESIAEAARTAAPAPAPVAASAPTGRKPAEAPPEVENGLQLAEAALAEGSSSDLSRHLQAIDALLARHPDHVLPSRLRSRLQALHAERQRLVGWQRWGGAVAREGIVEEAEALARATAAAQADPPQGRLDLHVHGEAIRKLRARWKELDRSGAAAGQALWLRFDGALTVAHAPVAAQQAAQKAARADNLAAREALLAKLEEAAAAEALPPRAAWQALQDFQAAWRKLGPLVHTVPAAALGGLQARAAAATDRIEAPLAEARAAAQREREALVERAEALVAADHERDVSTALRQLQADWQQHARALPLPRGVESALWARFRQAADALAARRKADLKARDAEAAAGTAAREALLNRLDALVHDASWQPAALTRALAQVDREWRELYTPLPRVTAAGLEARFHEAREAAARALESRRHALWAAQCEALALRLALCEEREQSPDADAAQALDRRWQDAPAVPGLWQRALDARWSGDPPRATTPTEDAETLLLRLEDALGIVPDASQAQARREIRLRALKDALEGRAATQAASPAQLNARWLALLVARRDLAASQRERLLAIAAAMAGAPGRFEAA